MLPTVVGLVLLGMVCVGVAADLLHGREIEPGVWPPWERVPDSSTAQAIESTEQGSEP